MSVKRSISQRIRSTLLKTKAKLSGGFADEDSSEQQQLRTSAQAQIQYSPVRQNSATGSEGSVDFPMMANAPIYTQVTSNGQVTSTNQGGVQVVSTCLPTNRKRSGSYARTRNISIHSSSMNSNLNMMDSDGDSFKSVVESSHSYEPNDEILLLPLGPNDTSLPQYTQQSLIDLNVIHTSHSISQPMPMNSDYMIVERPTLSLQNPSLTTSSTISQSPTATSPIGVSRSSIPTISSTPTATTPATTTANTTISSVPTTTTATQPTEDLEVSQVNMDPLFIKANQIDHLDKSLDVEQNDLLAEQMALNILQNISEEAVDELSKLKEEISHQI